MSSDGIIAGRFSPRFAAGFCWYVRRLVRSKFHAVRLAPGSDVVLRAAAGHAGPVIVAMNHSSWWDPLMAVFLARGYLPGRSAAAPMDREMLRKFGFFRRLGVFGVDPDSAGEMRAMARHVMEIFAGEERPTLWITPQGRFVDVRDEVVVRPGVGAIAAGAGDCFVVAAALEYGFWLDSKPEVFVRCAAVEAPERRTTGGWMRAMEQAMRVNAAALAERVRSRDPGVFATVLDSGAGMNPVYRAWLAIRGKRPEIDAARAVAPSGKVVA